MRLKHYIGFFVIALFLFTFIGIPAYSAPLLFGVYTSDKPTSMYKKFNPIIKHVEEQMSQKGLPVKIKIKIYSSYQGAIKALVKGDCDFTRFGPASYILAKEEENNIRLLAMEHKNNKKRFNGLFITTKDSPINSIQDIKGKSFAFGDENSTIGRYLSQAELVKAGIKSSNLVRFTYLGRHDKVAIAIATGNYDVGVVKENTFNKYAESRRLKKIAHFPNVTKPWVVKAGFDDEIFSALQEVFLDLKDKKALKSLKQHGFLKAADSDYDFVRRGMKLSEVF